MIDLDIKNARCAITVQICLTRNRSVLVPLTVIFLHTIKQSLLLCLIDKQTVFEYTTDGRDTITNRWFVYLKTFKTCEYLDSEAKSTRIVRLTAFTTLYSFLLSFNFAPGKI